MALRLKNWFFEITKTATQRGTRYRNGDRPPQATFSDHLESSVFKTEEEDRAKLDGGTFNALKNGHVTLATGAQVKNYTTQPTNRSLAVGPENVTEVKKGLVKDFPDLSTGEYIEVTKEASTKRNIFLVNFSDTFITWFKGFYSNVIARILPSGGTTGQQLVKLSATDYDVGWTDKSDRLVAAGTSDTSPGTLFDKLISGSGITIRETTNLGADVVEIKAEESEGLKVFYVDGNNIADGDGSILNPFRTLDLAYSAVIGTGSAEAPENSNITISVAGYEGVNYETSNNLLINTVTWDFKVGSVVEYTGTDYLFRLDANITTSGTTVLSIKGSGTFTTSSGGIIYVTGFSSASTSTQRSLLFEASEVISKVDTSLSSIEHPVFQLSQLNGFAVAADIRIQFQVVSYTQNILTTFNKASFKITGGRYFLSGRGSNNPLSSARLFDINNGHTGSIENVELFATDVDYYITFSNQIRNILLKNIIVSGSTNSNSTKAGAIIEFASTFNIDADGGGTDAVIGVFILNMFQKINTFTASSELFSWKGVVGDLNTIYMDQSTIAGNIDPTIKLAKSVSFGPNGSSIFGPLPVVNKINSNVVMSNLPTTSPAGSGIIWNNAGVLNIS